MSPAAARPAGGVREPPPAGRVDRADGAGRDGGGRRARHPAAGRRRLPRPHAAGVVEPGALEPDPALEPRGDRRGDRSVLGAPGRSASDGRGGPRRATSSGRSTAAKQARLRLAAKPQVRAGVAVLQVQVPDRPGALAELTSVLAEHAASTSRTSRSCTRRRAGEGPCTSPSPRRRPTTRSACSPSRVVRPDPAGLRSSCGSA